MTTGQQPEPVRDMSGRTDIEALLRDLPVVKSIEDINNYAVPEAFETDEEFEEFQAWHEADRRANQI